VRSQFRGRTPDGAATALLCAKGDVPLAAVLFSSVRIVHHSMHGILIRRTGPAASPPAEWGLTAVAQIPRV